MHGFPPEHCRVVALSTEGDDGVAVLDTGASGQPYLYAVAVWREGGRWLVGSGGNALGWTVTDHEHALGTLAEWDYAPAGADRVRVAFRQEIREVPVVDGAYLTAWWRLPLPEDDWPRPIAFRIAGEWTTAGVVRHGWSSIPGA